MGRERKGEDIRRTTEDSKGGFNLVRYSRETLWSELSGKGIDLLGPFDGHCDLFEVTVMDTKHVDHSGVVPELVKTGLCRRGQEMFCSEINYVNLVY